MRRVVWSMAWYDTASTPPCDSVQHLGEVLEAQGTPLKEVVPIRRRKEYHVYVSHTLVGRIGAAVDSEGWSVFFSPPGARRFISLWDWEECTLGKPRPASGDISTDESVEWVLELLRKGEPPEIDLECVERMARAVDRRVARDRWLTPLLFLGGYVIAIGLIVSSIFSGRVWTSFTAGVLLVNLLMTNLKPSWLRPRKKFKRE